MADKVYDLSYLIGARFKDQRTTTIKTVEMRWRTAMVGAVSAVASLPVAGLTYLVLRLVAAGIAAVTGRPAPSLGVYAFLAVLVVVAAGVILFAVKDVTGRTRAAQITAAARQKRRDNKFFIGMREVDPVCTEWVRVVASCVPNPHLRPTTTRGGADTMLGVDPVGPDERKAAR